MLKYRGHLGLLIILAAEILLFSGVELVSQWFTPIVWTGYILLMDKINYRLAGWSLLMDRRKEFFLMIPLSIVCWAIFEVYNLHLNNWVYIGLPENIWVRYFGYGWAFATIFPGIFQTWYFVENIEIFRGLKSLRPCRLDRSSGILILIGILFLIVPILLPESDAKYLFGLVWVGFILCLEPLNHRLGFRSLIGELERGDYSQLANLMAAGIICGLLWEFWNYWAITKWIYTLPFPVGLKYFEMPLLGFLGFLPFAVECYSMFNFCSMNEESS